MTKKLYTLLQQHRVHGADDANGTMLMIDLVVVGKSLELFFGITIYIERNKRNKPVEIYVHTKDNAEHMFRIAWMSITSLTKALSEPNQIFGTIVAFCEAFGISRQEQRLFFLDEDGKRHEGSFSTI